MANVEHLKLIEAVVGRMAANSFLIKGWTVTLVAGLSALATSQTDRKFALIAAGVVCVFALLDAFYLALERGYRNLYRKAAAEPPQLTTPWDLEVDVGPAEVVRALSGFAVWPLYTAAVAGAIIVAIST